MAVDLGMSTFKLWKCSSVGSLLFDCLNIPYALIPKLGKVLIAFFYLYEF